MGVIQLKNKQEWIDNNMDEIQELKNHSESHKHLTIEEIIHTTWLMYGKLSILSSNAGYYIGRRTPMGFPYNRETGYLPNKKIANEYLIDMIN